MPFCDVITMTTVLIVSMETCLFYENSYCGAFYHTIAIHVFLCIDWYSLPQRSEAGMFPSFSEGSSMCLSPCDSTVSQCNTKDIKYAFENA